MGLKTFPLMQMSRNQWNGGFNDASLSLNNHPLTEQYTIKRWSNYIME